MLFNLFGNKKVTSKDDLDKKYKASVVPPSPKEIKLDSSDDEIDVILGDNIKRSKYTDIIIDKNPQ